MTYHIIVATLHQEREFIASVVRKVGHTVDFCFSLDDIQKLLKRENYDVAIIDSDFEVAGQGWLLAKHLRQPTKGRELGIIILTRLSSPMSFMSTPEFQDVYDEILKLPITEEELLMNLERAFKLRNRKD